jgi:hypothetical protein
MIFFNNINYFFIKYLYQLIIIIIILIYIIFKIISIYIGALYINR